MFVDPAPAKNRPARLSAGRCVTQRSILVLLLVVWIWASGIPKASGATLSECIRTALAKNPNAGAAEMRVEAAEAMIAEAESAYYPMLFLAGNYAVTDNPTQAFMMELNQRKLDIRDPDFDPNQPDDTDNFRFSIGLKYRLYDRGKRGIRKTMAELGKDTATKRLSSIQNELIYQVTRGYYNVLQVQDLVSVQNETITSLEENLRVARERYGAGSVVKTDVLNLEVRLAQAREELIRAQNGVQLAIAALNTAIGEEMVTPEGIRAPPRTEDLPLPQKPDPQSIESRSELQAARKQTLMKEQEYKDAFSDYYPSINAFGSYDFDSESIDDFEDSYVVGVMAEWEFFSGFRTNNAVKKSNRQWQAARKDEENLRNNLKLDLQRAYIQALEAWQRLAVVRKSVESAREALRITRVRYREGAANITELLTAQVGLTASQSRDVAAYYDYLTAISNLERAQGRLVSDYVGPENN
jgi:outer membrane protein TolC